MIKAPINKIIPFSSVDGPGNRAAIFLQGCGYNCQYCHNPETIHLCVHCGACVPACPVSALFMEDGKVLFDHTLCCACDTCIKTCEHGASPRIRMMDAEQVLDELKSVLPFIRGITTSGGECTTYPAFLKELYTLAKNSGLETFMDTNGSYDFSNDPHDLLSVCDGAMLDIKAFSPALHKKLVGAPIKPVLEAAKILAEQKKLYEIRTVVIPELISEDEIKGIAAFMEPLLKIGPTIRYKLIKYRSLGVREEYRSYQTPSDELMSKYEKLVRNYGFSEVVVV